MQKMIFVIGVCLLAGSCEHDVPSPDPKLNEIPGKLKQIVTTYTGNTTDTTFENFFYDSTGRLIHENYLMKYRNQSGVMTEQRGSTDYERDHLGRLKKCIAGNIFYQSSTSTRVAHIADSASVFVYDAAGRVARIDSYERLSPGGPQTRTAYEQFTYDSRGNMIKREVMIDYDTNGQLDGVFKLNIGYSYDYDNFVNPLYPVDDAVIFYKWHVSPNNIIQQHNHTPAYNESLPLMNFSYRPDGKPLRWTMSVPGLSPIVNYYYY